MEVCYKCKLPIKANEDYIKVPWGWGNKVKMHVECYKKNKKASKKSFWFILGIIILILVILVIALAVSLS